MSHEPVITISLTLGDLQRFASNLDAIETELEGGMQPYKMHESMRNLVKVLKDLIPDEVYSAVAPVHPVAQSLASPTPAVLSRQATIISPAAPAPSTLSLGRRSAPRGLPTPVVPLPAPIEQPHGAGGVVQVVEGREVTPEDALAALQKVMPEAVATPVTAVGKAVRNALEHPLPDAQQG